MTTTITISGFGGQGVLFIGKFLAYKSLLEGKNVSWLPSYGPEMRGGTASCSLVLSTHPVGSPIVNDPKVLIAMNLPSLDRFEQSVLPGGMIFVDSTLVERKVMRDDVTVVYIPATKLASDNGIPTLANMILTGKILQALNGFNDDDVKAALNKVISARHADMLDINLKALKLGAEYDAIIQPITRFTV